MDPLEEFQAKYQLDPQDLERSQKVRKVVVGSLIGGFAFSLWAFILVTESVSELYTPAKNALIPVAAVVLLSLCFVVLRAEEVYDREDEANHHLATAIDEFQNENYEAVESHLFDLKVELLNADYLPEKRKKEVIRYVEAVEDTSDEAIDTSFEEFFETVTREILERDRKSLDDVIDSIQTNPDSQNSYFDILRSSIQTGIREIEVSFWTMFIFALVAGVIVFIFIDEEGGMLATTVLFGALKIYDQRQS